MFSEFNVAYGGAFSTEGLDESQRNALADFLDIRGEYLGYLQVLGGMQARQLREPRAVTQERIGSYCKGLEITRRRLAGRGALLFVETLDLQKLQQMAPMLLSVVGQSVHIISLLEALGVDSATARVIDYDTSRLLRDWENVNFGAYWRKLVQDIQLTRLRQVKYAVNHQALVRVLPDIVTALLQATNPGLMAAAAGLDTAYLADFIWNTVQLLAAKYRPTPADPAE